MRSSNPDGGADPAANGPEGAGGGQPPYSPGNYATLLSVLRELATALVNLKGKVPAERHEQQRLIFLRALQEVMSFLLADRAVREAGLTRPLAIGHSAWQRIGRGTLPAMMEDTGPQETVGDIAKGHLVTHCSW